MVDQVVKEAFNEPPSTAIDGRVPDVRTFALHQRPSVRVLRWAAERDLTRTGDITRPILEAYQRWLGKLVRPGGRRLGWSTQRNRLCILTPTPGSPRTLPSLGALA